MKRKLTWSRQANFERIELVRHFQKQGIPVARRFVRALRDAVGKAMAMPEFWGKLETDHPRMQNVRVLPINPFKNHLLYYEATDAELIIHHVAHGSRDVERLFGVTQDKP